jgi:phage-related tail protein
MTKLGDYLRKEKTKAELAARELKKETKNAYDNAVESAPVYFHQVTNSIANDWNSVTSTFTDGLSNAAQHVEDDAQNAFSTVTSGVSEAFSTVTEPISHFANAVEQHTSDIVASVSSDVHSTINTLQALPGKAYNAIAGLPDKIEEDASSVAHSLEKTAQVVWGDVTDPVKNLGRNIKKDLIVLSVGGLALLYILWHMSAPVRKQAGVLGKRAASELYDQLRENGIPAAKKALKAAPFLL